MLPSLLIIDDFLKDPWAARRAALALDYDPARQHGNFPGLNSSAPLDMAALDSAVSRLVGTPLTGAARRQHGHCRITRKGDKGKSGVHIDPASYSGILYLCGLKIVRSRMRAAPTFSATDAPGWRRYRTILRGSRHRAIAM